MSWRQVSPCLPLDPAQNINMFDSKINIKMSDAYAAADCYNLQQSGCVDRFFIQIIISGMSRSEVSNIFERVIEINPTRDSTWAPVQFLKIASSCQSQTWNELTQQLVNVN